MLTRFGEFSPFHVILFSFLFVAAAAATRSILTFLLNSRTFRFSDIFRFCSCCGIGIGIACTTDLEHPRIIYIYIPIYNSISHNNSCLCSAMSVLPESYLHVLSCANTLNDSARVYRERERERAMREQQICIQHIFTYFMKYFRLSHCMAHRFMYKGVK